MKCQYPGCSRNASYDMGWLDYLGIEHYGKICATHDKFLGRKNLERNASMTLKEAIAFERFLKETKEEK